MNTFWAKKNSNITGSTNTTDAAMVRFDSPVFASAVFMRYPDGGLTDLLITALKATAPDAAGATITLERPKQAQHGDFSCNVAMQLAKALRAKPRDIAQKLLAAENVPVRVVSMPSTSVFDRQDSAYCASVLPKGPPRIAVEAGVPDFWRKYVGINGTVIGLDTYGESAPAGDLFKYYGFTAESVAATVNTAIKAAGK